MKPTLRQRAEAAQQLRPAASAPTADTLHELQVHQIELEMQNEELRRTHAQMETLRSRYFDLYDLAPVSYFTVSEEGLVMEANLTTAKLLGMPSTGMCMRPFSQLIFPEDADIYYRLRQQVLAHSTTPMTCELRMVRPNGTVFWAQLIAAHTVSDDYDVRTFRIVVTDITERRQAEAALRASEVQHRATIEFAVDGILLGSAEGKITGANSRMQQLAGRTLEQLLDRPVQELFSVQELSANPLQFAVLRQGQTAINVRHLLRPNGTTVPVEMHSKMMPDGTLQAICRDISERAEREDTQNFLARTSSGTAAEPFFRVLARYLAQDLDMDFVCIDRLEGDGLNAQTVAVWCDGKFEDNVTYALKDTPCGDVVGKQVCCFPASVCQFFPRDRVLQDLRAESYVGATLWSHTGQPIGLIAVISRRPLANRAHAETTLKLVAERAAGELERQQAEAALRCQQEMLARTEGIAHVGSWEWEVAPDRVTWSEEMFRIFQRDPQAGAPSFAEHAPLYHPDDWPRLERAVAAAVADGTPYELELRAVRTDGHTRWCVARGRAERGASGHTSRLFGSLQDITERHLANAALKVLATSFAPLAGRAFFEAVSRHIATAIGVDFVFVGEYNPRTKLVGTLGGYARGGEMPDMNYGLTDTPGANVVGQKLCFYPRAVQTLFPQDYLLKELGIESYLGAPLFDKEGNPIGILVALHTQPLSEAQAITQLFDTFLDRVTAEMQRSKARAALRQSLREKEFLLKEVHHRVKNNLQIISSLLRLQSGRLENPVAKAALQDMQNRVRSMALIHEHLYRSENLARVDLAAYLKQLCQQLFRALMVISGEIQLHLELVPVHLEIDQAIPCGLLVNELVSNALKHGFPNGGTGEVRVELQPAADGPGWRLRVADNGVGLPASFDLKHLTTLGMQLIGDLSRQIGGQVSIGPGPGTVFEVTFQASHT
jgi:PAS domain S-box-containing protein